MAMKQPTPFQLRNPYRLDRPNFDAIEVVETALAEEEAAHRLQLLQQQYQSAIMSSKRPLPPQPSITVQQQQQQQQQQQKHSSSLEDDNQQSARNGIIRVSNSIKRIKDFQRKTSTKDTERRQFKQQVKQQQQQQQQQQHQQHQQQAALGSEEALPEYHNSYFANSWLQPKGVTLPLTKQQQRQQTQQPLPPIPSVTVTHYIDTHSELTFERHVEWLTQTALWWDMPVVHLYPAPESPASLEYVETAASRFASWVNFVKIPAGEDSRPGPATMAIKSANPGRVKGSRAKITAKETITISTTTTSLEEDDALVEGGMVMGHTRKVSTSSTATSSSFYDPSRNVDPVVGYVFVGSADEQAQYSQVFEAMERLYPMIEIRYINSFEPQHLQSRQQQELREEPCLNSLSWVHYWSAAKESQVLQSRIVNEVVRVRPMWVNNELLHRNYSPPPQFHTVLSSTAGGEPVDYSGDVVVECLSPCPESAGAISPSPSVYIGGNNDDDYNGNDGGHSLEKVLRGVPSSVSIESFLESDSAINEQQPKRHPVLGDRKSGYQETAVATTTDTAATAAVDIYSTEELDLHGLSKRRPSLGRTQSSHDIRHSKSSSSSSHRRSKKSRPSSSATSTATASGTSEHKINSELSTGYRRSASTPLLLLTKGSSFSKAASTTQHQYQHHLDSSPDSDSNMSPPPPLKSYCSSSVSNLPSSSSLSSTSSMATASSSMGFGHRLAGLAQRLGVYKVRGSALMVVDL
ncbi:hypothetical protein BGZ96_004795 [Linnemannia gamsii]|uniref:Uncharacterized protein n=1 Tax=Linnemannia gamsii TaxID=64522 RepID=A0ABQ7K6W1_9FUNG|nr:hypothetical protein BGZ96_004795 [Linnemannia gamsii]